MVGDQKPALESPTESRSEEFRDLPDLTCGGNSVVVT